jgi:hypothetical protein
MGVKDGDVDQLCDGQDAIDALNKAFGSNMADAYMFAKQQGIFLHVSNGPDLMQAYKRAFKEGQITVPGGWEKFVTQLPQSWVEKIVAARAGALAQNKAMKTQTHLAPPNEVVITSDSNNFTISTPYKCIAK